MNTTRFRPRHGLGLTAAAATLVAAILATPALAAAETNDGADQTLSAATVPAGAPPAIETGSAHALAAVDEATELPVSASASPEAGTEVDAAGPATELAETAPPTDDAASHEPDAAAEQTGPADSPAPSGPAQPEDAQTPTPAALTETADAPAPVPSAGIPTRVIQGTARDALGNPVAGMMLYLTGAGVDLQVETAADGTFAYPEVPVGSYTIVGFSYPSGLAPFERTFTLPPGDAPFALDPQFPLYSLLSGRVTAGANIGIEGVVVEFHYPGRILSTLTDANGDWSAVLAPGDVRVRFIGPIGGAFSYEWYDDADSSSGAAVLTLPETGTIITGIDAALDLGGHIRGHVYDGPNVTSNASVTVWEAGGTLVAELVTDATGSYVTPALPAGDYVVQATDGVRQSDKLAVTVDSTFDVFADCVLEVEIAPPPAPAANDDVYTTPSETLLQITSPGLLANDSPSDPVASELHVADALVEEPAHGEVIVASDGSFVYQPDDGFAGDDAFRYAVESPGGTASATVTIHVTSDGDAPGGGNGGQSGPDGALAVTGLDAIGTTGAAATAAALAILGAVLVVWRRASRPARETRA